MPFPQDNEATRFAIISSMILRHRDRELLRFEWTGARGVRVLSVNESERKFLPIDMAGVATDESLWKWISTRTVPRGRKYILAALRQLGIPSDDVRAIVEFSRGLSLNDVYWIVEDGFSGSWKDYNLYDNDFSNDVAVLALTGLGIAPEEKQTSSPEFSTNGMLRKCWRRVDGEVLLYKGTAVGKNAKNAEKESAENSSTPVNNGDNVNKDVGIKSTNSDSLGYQILQNMRVDKFITAAEIADILHVELRTVERRIKSLREAGVVVRMGSRKAGYWQVSA